MSTSDPRSWLDRAIGACLGLLFAAVALYIAVRLVEKVWVALLLIAAGAATVTLGVWVTRARSRGW